MLFRSQLYTDGNGCYNEDTLNISVINPTNADAGADLQVCEDTSLVQLTGQPVGGIWTGNGISQSGVYTVITSGSYDFTYSFGSGNCLTTDNMNLTIHPIPIADAGNDSTLCNQTGTVQFNGAPMGGVWTGQNMSSSGVFTPNGIGMFEMIYGYADVNG